LCILKIAPAMNHSEESYDGCCALIVMGTFEIVRCDITPIIVMIEHVINRYLLMIP